MKFSKIDKIDRTLLRIFIGGIVSIILARIGIYFLLDTANSINETMFSISYIIIFAGIILGFLSLLIFLIRFLIKLVRQNTA